MNSFLVQLQRSPQAAIICRTVVEDEAFLIQVGRKFFKIMPQELEGKKPLSLADQASL